MTLMPKKLLRPLFTLDALLGKFCETLFMTVKGIQSQVWWRFHDRLGFLTAAIFANPIRHPYSRFARLNPTEGTTRLLQSLAMNSHLTTTFTIYILGGDWITDYVPDFITPRPPTTTAVNLMSFRDGTLYQLRIGYEGTPCAQYEVYSRFLALLERGPLVLHSPKLGDTGHTRQPFCKIKTVNAQFLAFCCVIIKLHH
jgi:hypothetical protein